MSKQNRKITLGLLHDSIHEAIDDLAGGVSRGFNHVEKRLTNIEIDMKLVYKRLDKVEVRIDDVHDILKQFEDNDILNLQKRVQLLEKTVRVLVSHSK